MNTPLLLSGRLHCIECSRSWLSTWNTQSPHPICHECGGACVPEGPQLRQAVNENEWYAEQFRMHVRALQRTMS